MAYKAVGFDFNGVLSDGHRINEEVVQIVKKLRSYGYKTGIISNYGTGGAGIIRSSGISDHFDIIHVSGETGYPKPATEAFDLLAQKLGVKTKELIFIDDSPYCLSTANEAGYAPILYENYEKLILDLAKLGIEFQK